MTQSSEQRYDVMMSQHDHKRLGSIPVQASEITDWKHLQYVPYVVTLSPRGNIGTSLNTDTTDPAVGCERRFPR